MLLREILTLIAISGACSMLVFTTQDHITWQNVFFRPVHATSESFNFKTAKLADVLKASRSGHAVLIDMREHVFYQYGQIKGSFNIEPKDAERLSEELLRRLENSSQVIVYNNGERSELYIFAKILARKYDLKNLALYFEGWPEWRSCGLPIEMSEAMKQDVEREKL